MAAGVVHIPWYATLFRADRFAEALMEVAPVALRYNALEYEIQRSRDDPYRFLHTVTFESKLDWTRCWEGPEMVDFRTLHSGWYQVPVLYVWHDRLLRGSVSGATAALQRTG